MEGTVQYEGSGDVFFAFYNGNEQLTEMPKKDNPENLRFDHAECNNGASVEWNSSKWAPTVNNLSKTKTKCTLYFSETAGNYNQLEDLKEKNPSMFEYDGTSDNNLRYIGASPHNYIDIGDRDSSGNKILWRIIGTMKNIPVVDEYGEIVNTETLIKIIRADSIGNWSWDSSGTATNGGKGVNEWSQADLMTTLNFGAYWNKEYDKCYNSTTDSKITCDFRDTGITSEAKRELVKVRWNTGTITDDFSYYTWKITASYMYEGERSNNYGKYCSYSSNCSDSVTRKTTWDGFIGLMYPSDYGYAVGGSKRIECLAQSMNKWTVDCYENDWLYDNTNDHQWTITPAYVPSSGSDVVYLSTLVKNYSASSAYAVRPVAYLRPGTQIVVGEGTTDNPHTLK